MADNTAKISVELSDEAVEKLKTIRDESKSTAKTALDAVYAAIEENAGKPTEFTGVNLEHLAALVNALEPIASKTIVNNTGGSFEINHPTTTTVKVGSLGPAMRPGIGL